jgi:beta-glucanase (GH16 family)
MGMDRMILLGALVCSGLLLSTGCKKSATEPDSASDSTAIAGWTLVWSDEFKESTVNTTRWNFETGGGGWGNNELEYYTGRTDNAYQDQGCLVIKAQQEIYQNRGYTSARMTTAHLGDWLYGRVDVRAKLPTGKGLWPAIWMMPTDSYYGSWPASGEMDIMELLGDNPSKVYGTIHWAASGQHVSTGGSYTLPAGASFANGFHLFTYEWSADSVKWLVDGHQYFSVHNGSPFDKRFFLILNVAVGGNWPGNPDASTVFPQTMQVDYVRVYKKEGT